MLGTDQKYKTLIQLIENHDTNMGTVLKYGTMKNYTTTSAYLKDYLKATYQTSDAYLKHIDYQFILGFESYIRNLELHTNGLKKYMERLKKLVRLAEDLDWIE